MAARLVAAFLTIAPLASAQHEHDSHAAAEWIPAEILERPVPIRDGIGTVHERIETAKPEAQSRVQRMLQMVKLEQFRRHFPVELSGGMRKRVALAQVLAYDPPTLLMDEPFGALDAQLKLVMQAELTAIWEQTRKTVVFVTHDIAEAVALADRVVVFTTRPGRVASVHEIDLPRPRDVFRIRFDPRFQALYETLWSALEPDMRREEEAA